MCTSIAWNNGNFYIGRNMDISFDFDKKIVVVPRNYPFHFKEMPTINNHYGMIGTAMIVDNYPLFAEAVNEKGLYMAGLNFPEIAKYNKSNESLDNISVVEIIPFILCKALNVEEAKVILNQTNITDTPFMPSLPIPTLHFIISDENTSIVVECTEAGMNIYENKTGIMTNNPTFDMQMHNLKNYMHLSNRNPVNTMTDEITLSHYCMGMGALGLPGDYSSQSRFVKAYFLKANAVAMETESASIAQMFHMLNAVSMVRGSVMEGENWDITVYSCCINATKGTYYYKTYDSSMISAVSMHKEDLNSNELIAFDYSDNTCIFSAN